MPAAGHRDSLSPTVTPVKRSLPSGATFSSSSLAWLVVASTTAFVRAIDATGTHELVLAAFDGESTLELDRARVLVRDLATGGIVYDSQPGAPVSTPPTAALVAGSIGVRR